MEKTKGERTLADCVLEDEREGRITIAWLDGFHTFDFEEFMKQPVNGLLYDLNMNKATLLTMLAQENQQEAVEWVNRYAAMRVIERLSHEGNYIQNYTIHIKITNLSFGLRKSESFLLL